jgi:hypothetical protein
VTIINSQNPIAVTAPVPARRVEVVMGSVFSSAICRTAARSMAVAWRTRAQSLISLIKKKAAEGTFLVTSSLLG